MKKLIITDIDGTILHNGQVSDATVKTVHKLREAGHYYTVATGRHFLAIKSLSKKLGIDIPVICGNGTIIKDLQNQTIIHAATIPSKNVSRVHEICNKHNVHYAVYCTEIIRGTKEALSTIWGELRNSTSSKAVSKQELTTYVDNVIKILVIENDEGKRNLVRKDVSGLDDMHVAASGETFLDITVKGSDKGVAITKLAKHLNISIEDVIAFGDQENDLQMLRTAGVGVAMGNAVPLIKENIKTHTDTVANDGFSKYIKENIL